MTSTTHGSRLPTAIAVGSVAVAVLAVIATAQALRPAGVSDPQASSAPTATAQPSPKDGPLVPWALRLAPQDAGFREPPRSEPAQPCHAKDVVVSVEQVQEEPAHDGQPSRVRASILLTNDGRTCSLEPEARGVLLDEAGDVLPLSANAGFGGPAYAPPPPLEPGASASAPLTWTSWCGDDPGNWSVRLQVADATVRGEGGQDPPVPGCLHGTSEGLYGFGPWTVLNSARQPARDPQSALEATVRGPLQGRLGEVLPMVMRLSNPTRGPISLTPCPVFTWSVSRDGPGSFLRSSPPLELNCPAAPRQVEAGSWVDFQLELELSPALADGLLAPGTWWVHPAIGRSEPRQVTVQPAREQTDGPKKTCTWVVPPDADPRVSGVPPREVGRKVRQAVLRTNRGDVTVELDGRIAPCAVAAFIHHVEGGYWQGQPCYLLSAQRTFRNLDCGSPELSAVRAGFAFPSEARAGTDYPAGTIVLTHNESVTHSGSIRVLYGDAPSYADNFTVLGRVIDGLAVFEQVAAGGQKNGEFGGPRLDLSITKVELRP